MISNNNKPISTGTRLMAMILDHFFMTLVAMIFFLPGIIANISATIKISHEPADFNFMSGPMMYISMLGFVLYFCKDVINGRSIAKRILKLQVVDNRTGQVATPLQCLIRNIFCILWPIEVFVAISNTSRRLGDRVAGTKLVSFDPGLEQPPIRIGKLLLPVIISYGVIALVSQLTWSATITKTEYSKSSYSQAESRELEQLLADGLGQYLVPDIRVYDTIRNRDLLEICISDY
jgi:uncharacterized RDD family membrane protein YckC